MNITGKVVGLGKAGLMSKAGKPFTVHSVTLDNGQQFEVGFKQPFSVGQDVNVEAEMKYGKLTMTGPGGSSPQSNSTQSGGSSSGALAFPIPLTSKEQSICRQSALKAAIDVVNGMGARKISLPEAPDLLAEFIIEMAYKFTDFSTGNREVKMVNEKVGK
jgi:hypothetical protein